VGDIDAGALPQDTVGVLYASGASAPSEDADYFHARTGTFFSFMVGDGADPVWCKSVFTGASVTVALAVL